MCHIRSCAAASVVRLLAVFGANSTRFSTEAAQAEESERAEEGRRASNDHPPASSLWPGLSVPAPVPRGADPTPMSFGGSLSSRPPEPEAPTASQLLDEMPDKEERTEVEEVGRKSLPLPRLPPATVQLPLPSLEEDEAAEADDAASVVLVDSPLFDPLTVHQVDTHPPSPSSGSVDQQQMDWRGDEPPAAVDREAERALEEKYDSPNPSQRHDSSSQVVAAAAQHLPMHRSSSLSLPLTIQPSQMAFVPPTTTVAGASLSLPPMTQSHPSHTSSSSSDDISIPMSICEVPASQLQSFQPSQHPPVASQHVPMILEEPEQPQVSLDAHDLESSDDSTSPPAVQQQQATSSTASSLSPAAAVPPPLRSFVRQSNSNEEMDGAEDLLQFDNSLATSLTTGPHPLSPPLSPALGASQAPTSFSLHVSPVRVSLPSQSQAISPLKAASLNEAPAIMDTSQPMEDVAFIKPQTATIKRCLYPPNKPPIAPLPSLPPAALLPATMTSRPLPCLSPESDTPPCGQPNPAESESPSPPGVVAAAAAAVIAAMEVSSEVAASAACLPRPSPGSASSPAASSLPLSSSAAPSTVNHSPLRSHVPPISPRTPKSILSVALRATAVVVVAKRSVRFNLPLSVDADDRPSVSPRKPKPSSSSAVSTRSGLSAMARRVAQANARLREEDEQEKMQEEGGGFGSEPAAAADGMEWNGEAASQQLSMHLTSCSQMEASFTDEDCRPPVAAAAASSPYSLAAPCRHGISPTTSPLKPPILPLSEPDTSPERGERKQQHQEEQKQQPTAGSSNAHPITFSSDEYAQSQVFDEPYFEPWMMEDGLLFRGERQAKKEEPMDVDEEPRAAAAVPTCAAAPMPRHPASASSHSSSSSSSSSHSLLLSSSPPGFVVPSQLARSVGSVTAATVTTQLRMKEEALGRQEMERRWRMKQEQSDGAAAGATSPAAAASGKVSPNRLVKPLRAPPSFLSPPPVDFSQHPEPSSAAAAVQLLKSRAQVKVEAIQRSNLAAAAASSTVAASSISQLHTPSRSPALKQRVSSSAFTEDSSFTPPSVLTQALRKIKQEKSRERASTRGGEREGEEEKHAVPPASRVHKPAEKASARSAPAEDHSHMEDDIEPCSPPPPASKSDSSAAAAAGGKKVEKYKRPRVFKSEGSRSSAASAVGSSAHPKRLATSDGSKHTELPAPGIDNTLRPVVDGQAMEDIEECAEEPLTADAAAGKAAKQQKKKQGKKRPAGEKAEEPFDKKQRTLADTMALKTERVQVELDATPDDAVMLIPPPASSAASSAPAASKKKASKAAAAVVDPKQQSLSGFFTKAPPRPASAAVAPQSPSDPPAPSTGAPAASASTSPSGGIAIPAFTASKRTYAPPASARKRQKQERLQLKAEESKRHETIDLIDEDHDGDEGMEFDEPERKMNNDSSETESSADDIGAPPVVLAAMLHARTAVRSSSDPGEHQRLQRQLDAFAAAVAKPTRANKSGGSGSAGKAKGQAQKKSARKEVDSPLQQMQVDESEHSQVF
jgi:hypothetical protein